VWDYYSGLLNGIEDAVKAGEDGDYKTIKKLISEDYFFTERKK
jgi:hypothetical protein